MTDSPDQGLTTRFGLRHLRFGFWTLVVFLSLGALLEFLLGFKVETYVGVASETRRLMWRLAHAHGAMTGLLHLAYGTVTLIAPAWATRRRRWVSPLLTSATLLLPGGFFLGGFGVIDGDPGVGVFLAPLGGLFLILAMLTAALDVTFSKVDSEAAPESGQPAASAQPAASDNEERDPWSA